MLTPDPQLYSDWRSWARQTMLYIRQQDEKIVELRALVSELRVLAGLDTGENPT